MNLDCLAGKGGRRGSKTRDQGGKSSDEKGDVIGN